MRAFSNEGVMDLAVEVMLLRRKQARGQNQAVQVIKARHMAKLEQVEVHLFVVKKKVVFFFSRGRKERGMQPTSP